MPREERLTVRVTDVARPRNAGVDVTAPDSTLPASTKSVRLIGVEFLVNPTVPPGF